MIRTYAPAGIAFSPYSVSPLAKRPDAGAEAEEELGDLHARGPGGEVVAQLVHEDHHEKGEHDDHGRHRPEHAQGDDARDEEHQADDRPRLLGRLLGPGGLCSRYLGVGHRVMCSLSA